MPLTIQLIFTWGNYWLLPKDEILNFGESQNINIFLIVIIPVIASLILVVRSKSLKKYSLRKKTVESLQYTSRLSPSRLNKCKQCIFGIIIFDFVLKALILGGVQEYFAANWYQRDLLIYKPFLGIFYPIYTFLFFSLVILFLALTYLEIMRKKDSGFFCFFVSFVEVFLVMIFTGNRIFLVMLLIVFFCAQVFKRRHVTLLLLLTLSIPLMPFLNNWTTYRSNYESVFQSSESENLLTLAYRIFEGHDLNILFSTIKHFGNEQSFYYGSTFLKPLLLIFPREFWEFKPLSFTQILGSIFEEGTTSLAGTLFAELYANFGVFFIFIFPIFTMLFIYLSRNLNIIRSVIWFFLSFLIFRGQLSDCIVFYCFLFIFTGAHFEKCILHSTHPNKL